MDIDIDLSTPRNDMIRDEEGKYIYRINEERNEIDRFNRDFNQYRERRKEEMKRKLDQKLAKLNEPIKETPIYNKPIGDILVSTKDAFFGILDDLMKLNFGSDIFTKNNRLFHIGLVILIMGTILLIIRYFSSTKKDGLNVNLNINRN